MSRSTAVPGPERVCTAMPAVLCGRFQIKSLLGRGTFGEVWEAHDTSRDELVALKMLRRMTPEALYRFKQEFRSLCDIVHPNLVRLHELFATNEVWFFSMELLRGVELVRYARPDSGAPGTEVGLCPGSDEGIDDTRLRLAFSQTAAAVHTLHMSGRIHRDLKPSNVLVTTGGRAVVLDLGLVGEVGITDPLVSGDCPPIGTPAYMSPEQAAGLSAEPASDWYSFGVMLFEALTGQRPHLGSPEDIRKRRLSGDVPAPQSIARNAPTDLCELAAELLRTRPRDRPGGSEVLDRLQRGCPNVVAPLRVQPSTGAPFVGRTRELETLRTALHKVDRGTTASVHVRGPSGYGKSALVRRFLDNLSVEHPKTVVLRARCYERESLPYKALDDLVDALARQLSSMSDLERAMTLPFDIGEVGRLFPVVQKLAIPDQRGRASRQGIEPREQQARAFHALRELFARLGRLYRVVLFIDDVQWGDADSVRLLRFMMQPPDPPLLTLLLAYRDDALESNEVLGALRAPFEGADGSIEVTDLVLGPLEHHDTLNLARQLLSIPDGSSADLVGFIAKESAGIPFFVGELAQQCASPDDDACSQPPSVAGAIGRRINRLPAAARLLMDVLAISGRPSSLQQAALVGGRGGVTLAEAADALRGERLIITQRTFPDTIVEIAHDRIREASLALLSPDRQRQLHLAWATALENGSAPDFEALVAHCHAGGDLDRARKYMRLAAERAAEGLAFDRAASLYRRALDGCPPHEVPLLTRNLADALANSTRAAEAGAAYLRAAQLVDREGALVLRERAVGQFLRAGLFDDGIAAARLVSGSLGIWMPRSPLVALISFLLLRTYLRLRGLSFRARRVDAIPQLQLVRIWVCYAMSLGLALVQPVVAMRYQALALLLALRAGDRATISRALALESSYRATGGHSAEKAVRRIQGTALDAATRTGDGKVMALFEANRGVSAYLMGHWREALSCCDRADLVLRDLPGNAWELSSMRHFAAWSLLYIGRWAEARKRVLRIYRDARDQGDLFSEISMATGHSNLVWLMADDPEEAIRVNDRAVSRWTQGEFHLQHFSSAYARAQAELYRGDPEAALTVVRRCWRRLRGSFLLLVQHTRCEALEVRARCVLAAAEACDGARRRALLREAAQLARELRHLSSPASTPMSMLVEAGVLLVCGDGPGSRKKLEQAIPELEHADLSMHAQVARLQLARLIRDSRGRVIADEALQAIRAQDVVRPDRVALMLAPGFRSSGE